MLGNLFISILRWNEALHCLWLSNCTGYLQKKIHRWIRFVFVSGYDKLLCTNRYSCCCRVERLQLNPNVSKLHHVTLARHKFVRPAPRVKFATKRSQQRWLHRMIPTIKPRIRVKQTFVCRPSYCRSSEFFCLMHELNPQKRFLRILAWKTHTGT